MLVGALTKSWHNSKGLTDVWMRERHDRETCQLKVYLGGGVQAVKVWWRLKRVPLFSGAGSRDGLLLHRRRGVGVSQYVFLSTIALQARTVANTQGLGTNRFLSKTPSFDGMEDLHHLSIHSGLQKRNAFKTAQLHRERWPRWKTHHWINTPLKKKSTSLVSSCIGW